MDLNPKLLHKRQRHGLTADPNEAAEVRQLLAANKRLAQELEILKKVTTVFSTPQAS